MNEKKEDMDREFVGLFKSLGGFMGMDSLSTEIFYTVYISVEDMSLEELSTKTGYSLASVSSKVKSLEAFGMMVKMRKPGSKKIFVQTDKNLLRMMKGLFMRKSSLLSEIGSKGLPELIGKYSRRKLGEESKKKLRVMQELNKQIGTATMVMRKIESDMDKALEECER